tara:strand:- start:3802 stop:4917 length:1116 start_codon:yes stop_codon:yes gene_type:complete
MKKIPISNIVLNGNELDYVSEAVKSTWISSIGKFISQFESMFATYCSTKYAVSCSNGTTALHLAIESLNIGKGDEVIVPPLTFAATANAVLHSGAIPVFVDCSKDHWNIDPDKIVPAITSKTKAILAVHLHGHPCNMTSIMKIAKKYKLFVIEDCAESTGAIVDGKKVGSIGDIGCFSFFGNKIMTTGEGGMCTTNDPAINEKLRILRDHGMDKSKRYWHNVVGYNYRMTNLSAAIGVAQMEQLEEFHQKRKMLRFMYDKYINFNPNFLKPIKSPQGTEVDWFYNLNLSPDSKIKRDKLINELSKVGIDTRPYFYPLHIMPPFKKYNKNKSPFSCTESFSENGLYLPLYPSLLKKDVQFISDEINRIASDF